jgi:hypothetical protein
MPLRKAYIHIRVGGLHVPNDKITLYRKIINLFHKLVEKDVVPHILICFTSSNQPQFKLNFLNAY